MLNLVPQKQPAQFQLALEIWKRFLRRRSAVLGLVILLAMILMSIAAPLLTPNNPETQKLSQAMRPPSLQFPLGTDYLGRDMITRLLYGARWSLAIGFLAVALGLAVGVPLGALSGYYGGWIDLIIQRVADVLLSFPGFLLALSLVAIL